MLRLVFMMAGSSKPWYWPVKALRALATRNKSDVACRFSSGPRSENWMSIASSARSLARV